MTLSCIIRKKLVPATPEERVRQASLHWMIETLGYPPSQIIVEKALSDLPHLQGLALPFPDRRLDIIVWHQTKPLLVIECKAGKVGDKALSQLMGYRHWIGAPFAALIGNEEIKTLFLHEGEIHSHPGLPSYSQIIPHTPT